MGAPMTARPRLRSPNFTGWVCLCLLPLLSFPRGANSDDVAGDTFSKASCAFSIDLLKRQSNITEGNVVLSPSSVGILLAILQQGAKENTLAELETVLHLTAEQSKVGQSHVLKSLQREKRNVTLEWGNRAYIRPGFEIADAFNTTITESFDAVIQELNFVDPSAEEAARVINDWVKEVTHDNIKDIIPPCMHLWAVLTPDTVLILLNAIYYRGLWDVPFKASLTANNDFERSPNDTVSVPFMSQEERFIAGEDPESGIKWVDLPFKDEQFSMLFLLPIERHNLGGVLEKLDGSLLRNIIDDEKTRMVTLVLPKFKLRQKVLLAKPLQELGLRDIFNENANLDGITPNFKNVQVTKIIHEASVEIDETGSTASAATFFSIGVLSFPKSSDRLDFRADHPFFFFILDRQNKIPLFAGIVADPS